MKKYLKKLFEGVVLSTSEAEEIMILISEGKANLTETSALISLFLVRPISYKELQGFRNALMTLCVPINTLIDTLDIVGTGGDEKNTFNISTLSAIVVAASGLMPVAKHGNYGASSISGSSNVLSFYGYQFPTTQEQINKELEINNFTFFHAPFFHPALKNVAVSRKEMAIKTFFNMLGPIVNPANTKHKFLGTYSADLAKIYHSILQNENYNYAIVYSYDGYDEISLTSDFKIYDKVNGVRDVLLSDLNIDSLSQTDIYGGNSIEEAAKIFIDVLKCEATEAQQKIVEINSAFAIHLITQKNIDECRQIITDTVKSKKALKQFEKIIAGF